MDDQRFDALVRALGIGSTRRTILTALRAATLGGALSLLGQELGQAARGKKNRARQEKKRGRKDRARAVDAQQLDDESVKVGLCHRTKSKKHPFRFIEVSANAVPAHTAHGDLVACPGAGVIDSETCTCVCPLTEDDCPGNFVVDVEDCACVCPVEDITCVNLEVVDPDTCACVCPVEDIVCAPDTTLNPETCACEEGPDPECAGQVCETFTACNENPNCGCATTAGGGGFCVENAACGEFTACGADLSCPSGQECLVGTCCGTPVCVPLTQACPQPSAARSASIDERRGPTLLGN